MTLTDRLAEAVKNAVNNYTRITEYDEFETELRTAIQSVLEKEESDSKIEWKNLSDDEKVATAKKAIDIAKQFCDELGISISYKPPQANENG